MVASAPGATGAGTPGAGSTVGPGRQAGVRRSARNGTAVVRATPRESCTSGFRATVSGHMIERVVFSLDGSTIGTRTGSPFAMSMRAAPGAPRVTVRVIFKDATTAKTMTMSYRACAAAALHPHRGPSQFTG